MTAFMACTCNRLATAAFLVAITTTAFSQVQDQGPGRFHGPNRQISPNVQMMGQSPQQNQASTSGPAKPSATQTPQAAASPAQAQPTSLLQEPPKQAVIQADPNNLTIRADNASLTQTLQRIADKTGMQMEGLSGDQRVFGDFGPGAPRDVLNTLLTGTGYNIVMIGALDNGAPRQLILSQKKAGPPSAQPGQPRPEESPVMNTPDEDVSDGAPPPDDQPAMQQMVPPRGGEPPNGFPGRTPQQLLQQLQQQRQQGDPQGTPTPQQ